MNILYINGHPHAESFHAEIQKQYTDNMQSEHTVKVLELGKHAFDPVLRFGYAKRMPEDTFITKSQELIKWADHIVFAFPMWWGDAPALMKGWIERVFTPGVTYHVKGFKNNQLLKGKTADIIVTSRMPRLLYPFAGNAGIAILTKNLFVLTGIKRRKTLVLDGVGFNDMLSTETRRKTFLQKVAKTAHSL